MYVGYIVEIRPGLGLHWVNVKCILCKTPITILLNQKTRQTFFKSLKRRSYPYYFECILLPSTRCTDVPSFITLALIVLRNRAEPENST